MKSRYAISRGMLAFCLYSAPGTYSQWVQVPDLPGGRIRDYCPIGSGLFLAMEGRIFRSDDGGASWTAMASPGENPEVLSIEELDGTILAGTPAGVYQSSIQDVSWRVFDRPGLSGIQALSIWSYLGYLYIGSEGAVYKSIDQGRTWAESKTGLPRDARITSFAGIVKIAVAGTGNRGVFITESMNWIAPPDFDSANYHIRDLDVIGNKAYAVTAHGVLESGNLGVDWGPSSFSLPDITCLLGDAGYVVAGTVQGLNYSADKGKTWERFDGGIPGNTAIESLAALGENIFASTDRGVWRTTSPTVGITNRISNLSLNRSPLNRPRLHVHQGSRPLLEIALPDSGPDNFQWIDYSGRRVWSRISLRGIAETHSLP